MVFGTKHSLNPKPQLNLVINNVEIEPFEMTKLLGVTPDCKLSRSKHIDAVNHAALFVKIADLRETTNVGTYKYLISAESLHSC